MKISELLVLVSLLVTSGDPVWAETPCTECGDEYGFIVDTIIESPHPYPAGTPGRRVVWSHTVGDLAYPEIGIRMARFELAPSDEFVVSDFAGKVLRRFTQAPRSVFSVTSWRRGA